MSRPWMPLYVGDYVADTAHLSAAESGAYLHLIMHYWTNQGLPTDDCLLARIAKMTPTQWRKARPLIEPFFSEGWKHKRVEFELTEAERISAAGRAGGVASGKIRRERSFNGRSTIDERLTNDQPNDSATKREALQPQKINSEANASSVFVSSSPTSSSELRETQVERSSGRGKPKTPLPPDFVADRDVPRALGWSESRIDQQFESFKDSAKAHKRLYADWPAAWRNWVRSPYQTADKSKENSHDRNGKRAGSILDAIDRLEDRFKDGGDCETFEDALFRVPPRRFLGS